MTHFFLGRITLSKLADELHLEQAVIENRVKALSIDQKWTMVDDLILTELPLVREYINMIKKELTKSIKSNGCMSVVSLAQGLRLPYSLIKSMIIQHLDADNYMQYTTLPDIITTKEYAEDSKASIQSLLTSLDE
ncbi:hypothetical protein BD560DRAFT_420911 [Blakeslea trispora]|nr:hypothetical protein BD560DRAFT_420911 [Blakeslea trispora]